MYDLMLMAFQSDSTRVVSFCLAHDGDNRSFSHIGIPEGHHDLSHHQNDPDRVGKVAKIDLWYVQQFAKFLTKTAGYEGCGRKLPAAQLHDRLRQWGRRRQHPFTHQQPADSARRRRWRHAGLLSATRSYKSAPACNLFLSLADRMGMQNLERFGDSTGTDPYLNPVPFK